MCTLHDLYAPVSAAKAHMHYDKDCAVDCMACVERLAQHHCATAAMHEFHVEKVLQIYV